MSKITFEDRAVAFIDVLGFSGIVNQASSDTAAMNRLQSLVDLLSSAVPTFDRGVDRSVPPELIPKHIYISDSIILSAPLFDSAVTSYNGLEIIVMRCIQLTHHFLRSGYLIRGGISIGKTWHGDSNIVGPAYQDAYLLEKNGAEPRIVLSDSAIDQWKKGFGAGSRMCIIYKDSIVMVNGLHDFYIPGNDMNGVIDQTYNDYARSVDGAINSSLPPSAKEKWLWFKDYLESERGGKL